MESSNRSRQLFFGIVLPVIVVMVAISVAVTLVILKPDVETKPPVVSSPLVRVARVELEDRNLIVQSQGTVSPRVESQLVAEVSGRVIWVAESLASGGFFEKGDTLVKLDPFDYREALVAARAELAGAKLRLAQEEAEARVARREWEELGTGAGDPLTLREPQLEDARAAVAAATSGVERAERNLARTRVKAPYAGRVRREDVNVGQFVTVGAPIATIYAVDAAEVKLPLPDDELAFVDLPLTYRGGKGTSSQPRVVLSTSFAGKRYTWEGLIVRTEGEIDPKTRMVNAVARVEDPYAPGDDPLRPPLSAGMFVEAAIDGKLVTNVAVLPRAALRTGSRVLVVDPELRLRYRDVSVLRATEHEAIISQGLRNDELVVLSALDAITDGMRVRIADEEGKSL